MLLLPLARVVGWWVLLLLRSGCGGCVVAAAAAAAAVDRVVAAAAAGMFYLYPYARVVVRGCDGEPFTELYFRVAFS